MKVVLVFCVDVFWDKILGFFDKRFLMCFFKLVFEYIEFEGGVIEVLVFGDFDKFFVEFFWR